MATVDPDVVLRAPQNGTLWYDHVYESDIPRSAGYAPAADANFITRSSEHFVSAGQTGAMRGTTLQMGDAASVSIGTGGPYVYAALMTAAGSYTFVGITNGPLMTGTCRAANSREHRQFLFQVSGQILEEVARLKDGWDGFGGQRPSDRTIATLQQLLPLIPMDAGVPDVEVDGGEGMISFRWYSGDSSSVVSLSILEDKVTGVISARDRAPYGWETAIIKERELARAIESLMTSMHVKLR